MITSSLNLYFLDAGIADLDNLIAGLPDDAEIHLLNRQTDGIDQMLAAINGRKGLASIHILSHGAPGQIQLGSTHVDVNTLDIRIADFAALGNALGADGDILLYGCNVAAGELGQSFISALAQATGADVAASTDLTGNSLLGGNWTLEATTGAIQTNTLNANIAGVLNVINGTSGNDTLHGTPSDDTINGLAGDDLIIGDYGNDTIYGGDGNDTINANQGDDIAYGDDGNDLLGGGSGNDFLYGGNGDDLFTNAVVGDDLMDGGDGNDTVDYGLSTDKVWVRLYIKGAQLVSVNSGTDTLISIENVTGSNFDDQLAGNSNNNTLTGGLGDDVLNGREGNDNLNGGAGIDTAAYWHSTDGVTVNLNTAGAQFVSASSGTDTLISIENLAGSQFNDTLTGDSNDNFLYGYSGNDQIFGGIGNDNLFGGDGNDTLNGNEGDDSLYGGGGDDILGGGSGNDILYGENGDDLFTNAVVGDDYMNGGAGNDTADYGLSTDAVTVRLNTSAAQFISTNSGTDRLISIENLIGSNFNDTLTGNSSGNTLSGGLGSDNLTGLGGADNFVFNTALGSLNVDTITDFQSGQDLIALSASIFTVFAGQEGNKVGLSANLLYDAGSGALSYDADGLGAGAPVEFAILGVATHPGSLGNDFWIVA